jgi:hypothetical protein
MQRRQSGVAQEALLGAVGSAAACLLSNPLDVARVRVQTAGQPISSGPLEVMRRIARTEGPTALWRGLRFACAYNVVLNSMRFSLLAVTEKPGDAAAGGAAIAGAIAGFVASPLAQARAIQQLAPGRLSTPMQAVRARPFAGAVPWAVRNGGHTAITFGLYSRVKRELSALPGMAGSLAASCVASCASCVVMNPVDVVATRCFVHSHRASMLQLVPPATPLSPLVAARQIARTEGLVGFTRGTTANVARVVPHMVTLFSLVELMRQQLVAAD